MTIIVRVITKGLDKYFSSETMNGELFNEHFQNLVINPKLIINDQNIDEEICTRTDPEELYPSFMGEKCSDESIGFSQVIRFKIGGIYIDNNNSKPGRYPFDLTMIKINVELKADPVTL